MTSKSKKDKIKQGNQKDFDLLYDVLVSGGTYSDYRSELLDRSMPQEQLNFDISEDDVLAAWILGKDEESELYARGGYIHSDGDYASMAVSTASKTGPWGLFISAGDNTGDILQGISTQNFGGGNTDDWYDAIYGKGGSGFASRILGLKDEFNNAADYIKNYRNQYSIGDNASLYNLITSALNLNKSTSNAKLGSKMANAIWQLPFTPDPLLNAIIGYKEDFGIAKLFGYDPEGYQKQINQLVENLWNLNIADQNTAIKNSQLLSLNNQLSQPYMAACGGKMKNKLASGGYINSHYDYITDPLVKVDAGGTHQENPNEGVLTSIAPDGEPNLVEEGETIINNQDDAYVFSDRIVADDEILKSHLLPNKFAGKTYADISKELDKIIEEHKNDEISKRTFDEMISRLQQAQEDQKFQEKQEEVEKFLDGLTDEQKEQLEQTMVEEAEAEQQAAEEQAVAEQQAQELAALEQQMQPEQAPEQVAIEQPEEQIVPSRYDQMMSRTLFADAANQGMFGLGGTLQEGGFIDRLKKTMTTSSHPQVVYWDNVRIPKQSYGTFGGGQSGGASYSGRWGDVDYVRNIFIPPVTETFDEAFARHRKAGDKVWEFDGKLYNSEIDPNYKGNPKAQNRIQIITPALNEREVYTNTGEKLNDSTRVEPYVGQPIGWTERETIDDKTKLKYIGSEPDWDNKKSKGGHINLVGNKLDLDRYEAVKALYDLAYNNRYGNNRGYYNYPGFTDDYIQQLQAIDKFNSEDSFKLLYPDLYPYLNPKVTVPFVNTNNEQNSYTPNLFYGIENWNSNNRLNNSVQKQSSLNDASNYASDIFYRPLFGTANAESDLQENPVSNVPKKRISTGSSSIKSRNGKTNISQPTAPIIEVYSNPHRPDYSIFGQYIPSDLNLNLKPNRLTPYEVNGNLLGYTDPLGRFVPIGGYSDYGDTVNSVVNEMNTSDTNTSLSNTSSANNDSDKDKTSDDKSTTDWSTYLRYAPVIGSGIQYLSDLFGVTNRNDFSNADMFQKRINDIPNIGFTPLGNYMTYSPLDETYQQNVARSQYNAARRAIQNNASGNASAALAAMNSLNGNMNNTFGDLALQAREYNDKQREAIEQFNANIARINSMMSLSTQEKNQAIAAEKARLTYNLANMRENIQNMNDAAKSANENAFYSNLGAIGKENFNMLMVRTNPAFYYTIMDDGSIVYKNGFYDLNKGDLDLITADAEKAQKEQLKKNSEDALKKSEDVSNMMSSPLIGRYFSRPGFWNGYQYTGGLTNNRR